MRPHTKPFVNWPGHRLVRALLFAVFVVALALVAVAMLGNAQFIEARDECIALARSGSAAVLGPFCVGLQRGQVLWSYALYGALAVAALAVWAWVATHRRR